LNLGYFEYEEGVSPTQRRHSAHEKKENISYEKINV
jgi:hypothetical protein